MVQINETYKIQRTMMSITGVWHVENASFFYRSRCVFTWSIFMIAFVGVIMEFFNDLTNLEKLCQILYMMLSYTSYFCKMVGFTYNKKTFLAMLNHLNDPLFVLCPREMEKHVSRVMNMSILLTKMYRFACGLTVLLFTVYPVFDNKSLPMPFPFELGRYTPLMYAIQSVALMIAAWNNFCLDTLCVSLMGLAYSEFDVLKYKIINVGENALKKLRREMGNEFVDDMNPKVNEIVNKMLNNCIQHHCAIITFVEQIETIFSFGLLTQFLGSIIVICNTGFFMLLISPASFQFGFLIVYFITMMAQLTMYCWYGNEIILKSVEISEACYFSNWYTFGTSIGKTIFVVMERSKRPLSITAWKFSDVSLATYGSIIQWSYSYFALLQRLANNRN